MQASKKKPQRVSGVRSPGLLDDLLGTDDDRPVQDDLPRSTGVLRAPRGKRVAPAERLGGLAGLDGEADAPDLEPQVDELVPQLTQRLLRRRTILGAIVGVRRRGVVPQLVGDLLCVHNLDQVFLGAGGRTVVGQHLLPSPGMNDLSRRRELEGRHEPLEGVLGLLQERLALEELIELVLRRTRPARRDERHPLEGDGVVEVGLVRFVARDPPAVMRQPPFVTQQREQLQTQPRIEGGGHELPVADDVVGPHDEHRRRTAMGRLDHHGLIALQGEVERLVRATDPVGDHIALVAGGHDVRIDGSRRGPDVGLVVDADDSVPVTHEREEEVQDREVRSRVEAGADLRLVTRRGRSGRRTMREGGAELTHGAPLVHWYPPTLSGGSVTLTLSKRSVKSSKEKAGVGPD